MSNPPPIAFAFFDSKTRLYSFVPFVVFVGFFDLLSFWLLCSEIQSKFGMLQRTTSGSPSIIHPDLGFCSSLPIDKLKAEEYTIGASAKAVLTQLYIPEALTSMASQRPKRNKVEREQNLNLGASFKTSRRQYARV